MSLRSPCILRICLGTQPSFPVIGWVHLIQPIQFGLSSYYSPVIRISPSRNSIELFLLALYPDIVLYDGTWLSSIEGCESLVAEASRINSKILLLQFYLKYNMKLTCGRAVRLLLSGAVICYKILLLYTISDVDTIDNVLYYRYEKYIIFKMYERLSSC